MFKMPTWFSGAKKPNLSSAELGLKLKDAESAQAAAEGRVEEARATLASERSEAALAALRVAKLDAEDVAAMLTILRADHQAAIEREHQAHLARVRVQRDEARAKRAEHVSREADLTAAAARALITGWIDLHLERGAACYDVATADRLVRKLSLELGEVEPAFTCAAEPSSFALAEAIVALGHELVPGTPNIFYSLVKAVEPRFHDVNASQKSLETRQRLAEERRVESLNRPPNHPEVVRIGELTKPREDRPMVAQMKQLLNPEDAA